MRADLWIPHYLPHWTDPGRSLARYRSTAAGLELRIEEDQLPWRPEDGPLRVSHIQTAAFSGPIGSSRGTHRHRPDLVVRTEVVARDLFAPTAGRIEVTVAASTDTNCMVAVWLVGTERWNSADSGEICVCEIDADAIGDRSRARVGIKAHHDPRLTTDMDTVTLPFRADRPRTWSARWGGGVTQIACEGKLVRQVPQAPDYPMQVMIDLFEFGEPSGDYPKTATVSAFRGWDDSEA